MNRCAHLLYKDIHKQTAHIHTPNETTATIHNFDAQREIKAITPTPAAENPSPLIPSFSHFPLISVFLFTHFLSIYKNHLSCGLHAYS